MKKKNNMKNFYLPWSKSISNRCLILWALAEWESNLRGVLESDDTKAMIQALKELWFQVSNQWGWSISIVWWIESIKSRASLILDGNESGTSVRFLAGLAILFVDKIDEIIITGSDRMCQRPVHILSDSIEQLGIKTSTNEGCPPLRLSKNKEKNIIDIQRVVMNGNISSQYFTSLLQIGAMLPQGLEIEVEGNLVSKPYIDITIHELKKFGVEVVNNDYKIFRVEKQVYKPVDICIEWDASALSYIATYIFLYGWELQIKNLWAETKQWDYSFLNILKQFWLEHASDWQTTTIKSKWMNQEDFSTYTDLDIDFSEIPDVSLTFMVLAILFPGKTKLRELQTLNLKECRRIDAMAAEIKKLWVTVKYDNESMTIGALGIVWRDESIDIETYNDHRIAMSFGILNSYIWWLNILDKKCVNKTYPNFWKDLDHLSWK